MRWKAWMKALLARLLPWDSLGKSVGTLVGGTAGAQLMWAASAPLLSRLYAPADYGVIAAYLALIGLVAPVATLTYQHAIPLPEADGDARALLVLALLTLLLVIFGTLVGALLVSSWDFHLPQAIQPMTGYLFALPIGIGLECVHSSLAFWALRKRDFKAQATARLYQAGGGLAAQVALSPLGATGLLIGQMFAQGAGIPRLYRAYRKGRTREEPVARASLMANAAAYRKFPFFTAPAVLFNDAGASVPTLILTAAFGPATGGVYYLALRMLWAPLRIVTDAYATVIYREAVDARRENRLDVLVILSVLRLWTASIPVAALVAFAAPLLFEQVFGAEWRDSGEYVRSLMWWIVAVAWVNPISGIPAVLDRQDTLLRFELGMMISRIAAVSVSAALYDAASAILIFALVAAAGLSIKGLWILKITGALSTSLALGFFRQAGLASAALAILTAVSWGTGSPVPVACLWAGMLLAFGLRGIRSLAAGVRND